MKGYNTYKNGSAAVQLIFVFLFMISCNQKAVQEQADVIFYGGPILTMEDGKDSLVEAIAIKDGKLLYVGKLSEVRKFEGEKTIKRDLAGKVLLPGFIDAHGHLTSSAGMEQAVDLSPAPYGKVNSIPELQQVLKAYIQKHKIPDGTPIMGNGYDDAIMIEHRHPTRQELDGISQSHPIIVIHASGHASVANSAMLNFLDIGETVKDPEGGHYGRNPLTKKLNGKLEENANFSALIHLTNKLPKPGPVAGDSLSPQLKNLLKAQDLWLRYGQTTICDGRTMGESVELLKEAAGKKLFKADIVYFPDYEFFKKDVKEMKKDYMKYNNRLKLGGFKFSDDGSPQGKTAWLTQPYLVPPEGKGKDYKGFPIFEDSTLYQGLKDLFQQRLTAQLHVNGDAAIDQALRVIQQLKNEGIYHDDLRATLIHVQNSRPDHIAKIKNAGVIPSYFSSHVYLWGDWHYSSVFGPGRSAFLSPAHAALAAGIPFTIHHDAPVTPPDLLTGVYAAVNRKTRSGRILGTGQRISVMQALKAITINAAYQYQEEDRKGSIKVGKLADLVILDQNPLQINPEKLRDIKILETIKEGVTVFAVDK